MAGGDRSRADSVLIAALASGQTVEAAARLAGVSEGTVYRRLRKEEFKQEIRAIRASTVERISSGLTELSLSAVDELKHLLSAKSESVRLAAAKSIIELGTSLRESHDIEERLAALEQSLGVKNGRSTTTPISLRR